MGRSLKEYVAAAGIPSGTCRVCASEYRTEIDDGFRAGIGATSIFNWLADEHAGTGMTDGMLRHHQRNRHYE